MAFDTQTGFSVVPCGYQQITNLAAAVGLSAPSTRGPVHAAIISAETQSVRWRDDGTDPTAAVGTPLEPGQTLAYTGDLSKIKFIEVAASAKLNIHYYQVL